MTKEKEETLVVVEEEKKIIDDLRGNIDELKSKLNEAAETLKNNNETIDLLKNNLTEAQKFSFRALLSSKQTQHTQILSAAAPTLE